MVFRNREKNEHKKTHFITVYRQCTKESAYRQHENMKMQEIAMPIGAVPHIEKLNAYRHHTKHVGRDNVMPIGTRLPAAYRRLK